MSELRPEECLSNGAPDIVLHLETSDAQYLLGVLRDRQAAVELEKFRIALMSSEDRRARDRVVLMTKNGAEAARLEFLVEKIEKAGRD